MNKEVFALALSIHSISDEYGYDLWDINFDDLTMYKCVTYEHVDLEAVSYQEMKKIFDEFLKFHESM